MTDLHAEVGSYVTDALDQDEREAFEAHLLGCEHCRREVTEFDETLAEFAALTAATPPISLRTSVLAGIREVRPLPPLGEDSGPETPVAIEDLRPVPAMVPGPAPDWDGPVDELAHRRAARRTRILTLAVAATLVVALGLGGWVFSLVQQQRALVAQQQLGEASAQRERALLSAPDAKVVTGKNLEGGSEVFSFVYSKQRNEALFLGTGLSDPGAGKTFQLWTLQGTAKTPAPNALVAGFGKTQTWLDGGVDTAGGFAVSIEPATGATTPTEVQSLIEI